MHCHTTPSSYMYVYSSKHALQVTNNGLECDDDEANAPDDLLSKLQAHWGSDASYNFTAAGIAGVSSTSCGFAAAAGIIDGRRTIGAMMPTTSGDGRFTAFTTDFPAAKAYYTGEVAA